MPTIRASDYADTPDDCYDSLKYPILIDDGKVQVRFFYDISYLKFRRDWRGWYLVVEFLEIA